MNKKIMKILMVQKEQERRPSLDQNLGEPPAVLNENRIQKTDLQKKLQIIGRGMIFLGSNGQSPRPESRSIRTRGELQPTGKISCLKTEFQTTHLLPLPPEQQHTWLWSRGSDTVSRQSSQNRAGDTVALHPRQKPPPTCPLRRRGDQPLSKPCPWTQSSQGEWCA